MTFNSQGSGRLVVLTLNHLPQSFRTYREHARKASKKMGVVHSTLLTVGFCTLNPKLRVDRAVYLSRHKWPAANG
jgi:hypothetical protein